MGRRKGLEEGRDREEEGMGEEGMGRKRRDGRSVDGKRVDGIREDGIVVTGRSDRDEGKAGSR